MVKVENIFLYTQVVTNSITKKKEFGVGDEVNCKSKRERNKEFDKYTELFGQKIETNDAGSKQQAACVEFGTQDSTKAKCGKN